MFVILPLARSGVRAITTGLISLRHSYWPSWVAKSGVIPIYAKVFEQILDSSLAEDFQVRHVFEDLLKLADREGIVDRTHESIARRINCPVKMVRRAIAELEKPDPLSRTKDHAGKRIIRLDPHRDWGWKIVNHAYYRQLQTEDDKREKAKIRMRNYREENALFEKSEQNATRANKTYTTASVSASVSASVPEGSAEGGRPEAKPPWTSTEFAAAAKNLSIPDKERDNCWSHYDSQGWRKANGLVISGDPRSLLTGWHNNPQRQPTQKAKHHVI